MKKLLAVLRDVGVFAVQICTAVIYVYAFWHLSIRSVLRHRLFD